MIRALEIRKSNSPPSTTALQRRQRPAATNQGGTDGAERALQANMLQHMVDVGVATELSYNTAMDASLGRKCPR